MKLRYFTFKSEYDLKQLEETGKISTPDNLCENFLFEVLNRYTRKNGIVWFWASYDGLVLDGYLGHEYRIEFKEPKKCILLTPERFKYLSEGIIKKYDKELDCTTSVLEGSDWLFNNTDIKEYIEDFKPTVDEVNGFNPNGVLPVSNLYMGIMPELLKEDIISIEKIEE